MKVLVIFTGGTIGSTVQGEYIATDGSKPRVLIEEYRKRVPKDEIEFVCEAPYTILSENLSGNNLNQLGMCVKNALIENYDGIIVTHGTDTLQYSAAAIAYAVGDIKIPVMFVSSNYVLEDPRANGLDNFYCAVEFIKNHFGKGVFIAYRNQDGKTYIHSGIKALAHATYSDEVYSVCNQYYGVFEKGIFYKNDAVSFTNPSAIGLVKNEYSNILRMNAHPGMVYSMNFDCIRGILLESYHSGTLCAESARFQEFFDKAKEKKIPIYLVGANNEIDYESVKMWNESGIKVLPMISPIAAYIQLWIELDNLM